MHFPVLSIIVPVYNVEKYLEECVKSIRFQTLKDIEIILVDDGSLDQCPQLCDSYAALDSRIKVIHKKNGGLGYARNSGLEIATGNWVTFIDSDDYVDSDAYSYLLSKYDDQDPDVIYYRYRHFNTGAIVIGQKNNQFSTYQGEGIKELMLDIIAPAPNIKKERVIECSACTAIYRRLLLVNNQLSFHSERELISEDMIFNLDVLSKSNIVIFDKSVLYFYRNNALSLTGKIMIDKHERILIFDNYIETHIKDWQMPAEDAMPRIKRMTVGKMRSFISSVLLASVPKKTKTSIFNSVLSNAYFESVLSQYPRVESSLYQKLFLLAMRKKSLIMAYFLSKIKKLFSK